MSIQKNVAVKTARYAVVALLGMGAQSVFACGSQPFLGEVCTFATNFCPKGFAEAAGQILPISQNTALFALLGTNYGGNGQTTFALPDLRGRVVVGEGQGPGLPQVFVGETFGASTATLTTSQLPAHTHTFNPSSTALQVNVNVSTAAGTASVPSNAANYLGAVNATAGAPKLYTGTHSSVVALGGATATGLTNGTVGATGGNQPIPIQPPSLGLTYCIALQGIFPSQN
ncbi:phage tail protein [Aquirhabdus sp.]|uniref:phage tail protein n=1 Tax=Aquirhabdus sp. TaxID=2824160 RepID=UPI00396C7D91